MPGSQSAFPLIPDSDQNKEDTSFISVVACGVYIHFSRPIQFCRLLTQILENNARNHADPAEPRIQDPSVFILPIFRGFKSFHQIPVIKKTL